MKKKKLVVLSGAGISAESGLKTFRDSDGLWEGYDIEDVATPRAWKKNPQLVLEFYNSRRRDVAKAQPNAAHFGLSDLEKDFDVTVITQNIDDLHERAGSSKVVHLHGEIFRMCSERDRSIVAEIRDDMRSGHLAPDGFAFRPDIVWFEEPVPMMDEAAVIASEAEIFVVIGTSLQVYPAAGLISVAPPEAIKFIIDRQIPYSVSNSHFRFIGKPATEGINDLKRALDELI
jgi:NAD-dependent deacetylase